MFQLDTHLQFATLADCQAAKSDLQNVVGGRGPIVSTRCVRLKADAPPDVER
jgi:hypothetical protein